MPSLSYIKTHNKLIKRYRRHCIYSFWGVCLSLVGIIIFYSSFDLGMFKYLLETNNTSANYRVSYQNISSSLGGAGVIFSSLHFFSILYISLVKEATFGAMLSICLIPNLILLGLFVLACYYAYKGKRWALYFLIIVNIIDFVFLPFFYLNQIKLQWTILDTLFSILVHMFFIFFPSIALFENYQIVKLRKKEIGITNKQNENKNDKVTIIKFTDNKDSDNFVNSEKD